MLVKLKKTWLTTKGRFRAHEKGVRIPDELFDILPSGAVVLEPPKGRGKDVGADGAPSRNADKAAKVCADHAALARIVADDKLGKPVDPATLMKPQAASASAPKADAVIAKARPAPEPRRSRASQ